MSGSDAGELAECAAIAQAWGYDEVNLNVGCPSDRVQNNMIGACLMGHPEKVAAAVKALRLRLSSRRVRRIHSRQRCLRRFNFG